MYRLNGSQLRSTFAVLGVAAILSALVFLPGTSAATRLKPKSSSDPVQVEKRVPVERPSADSANGKGTERPPEEFEVDSIELRESTRQQGGIVESALAPGTTLPGEVEPNGTSVTATPIIGTASRLRANIQPNADVDFYSFSGAAGDRVYVATQTGFSASLSSDTVMSLIAPDGTTILETDDDEGTIGTLSSTISGRALTATGTHFIRVAGFNATTQIRPYDLFFQLRTGAPVAETESNNTFPGQPIPASGWISGATSSAADADFFAVALNAGDTVFLSLDLDPERDVTQWNGMVGIGTFGTANNQILVATDSATTTPPNSEAFFMTVRTAGTYGILAQTQTAQTTFGTYHLSVTVFPRVSPGTCTTYTSTNVPVAIGAGAPPITVTSTLTVPGNPRIAKLRVNLDITHTFLQDLDVQLTAPNGTTIGLFSDIGNGTVGGPQTTVVTQLDDDAGIPIGSFVITAGPAFQPEATYRLGWLQGIDAGGTWTLTVRDDFNGDGGMLNGWGLEICEDPQPLCGGPAPSVVYFSDFETGDGGFTHSGTADEWERGLPAFAPITTANSGTNAWKTDLDNTYNATSSQDLLSPNIVLPATGPIRLSWAQKYQMENANNDHIFVEVRQVGNPASAVRLFEFRDATMTDAVGAAPVVTIQEAAGWQTCQFDISTFAGQTVEVRFHLDSNATTQLAGFAIDDVRVESCASCVITCPANVTQGNDAGLCSAVVNYPPPTPTMACGPVTCSPASGSTFPVGVTTVTCMEDIILLDPEGNPVPSCSFTVTVQDTEAPTITCPANVTQANDAGQCSAVVTYAAPTVADNCAGVGTPACTPASGSAFPVGTTTVTCTVADASPDSPDGMCTFTVTVNDTEPPPITCPANVTQGNDAGQCGAVVNFTTPTPTDNCPAATTACTPATGSFFPVGTTTVSCTTTDASGNTATCSFSVTVNDTQAPAITCPANIISTGADPASCSLTGVVTYALPTVTDNCPGVGVPVCTPPSGSVFVEGTTTVNCSVTDAVGNTSMCSFTVTISTMGVLGVCIFDDFSGDSWAIATNPASPAYGFWRYRVAATGEVFCGTASHLAYIPSRSLTAADTDDRRVFMNANINYGARTGTVKLVDQATGRQFVIRDRNVNNNPPCQ